MMMRPRLATVAVTALLAGTLLACSPVIRTHGYMPVEERLDRISAGVDTRGSVQRKIGRPATESLFAPEDAWYYVSSIVKEETYKAPKVIDRKVAVIRFDDTGLVTGVERYGLEDGRVIDLKTRTTPTYGTELTIIEQLFGNLISGSGGSLIDEQ